MRNRYIEAFEKAQIESKEIPQFRAGDTLRVGVRIKEGEKTRVQNFEGTCIALRGEGTGKMFTVRKIGANGIGVEKTRPLHSPIVEKVEVVRLGKARRAKLNYLRGRVGKAAKVKELVR